MRSGGQEDEYDEHRMRGRRVNKNTTLSRCGVGAKRMLLAFHRVQVDSGVEGLDNPLMEVKKKSELLKHWSQGKLELG